MVPSMCGEGSGPPQAVYPLAESLEVTPQSISL